MGNSCTKADEPPRGHNNRPQANEHDRAVLQLKVARDKVSKFKKKVQKGKAPKNMFPLTLYLHPTDRCRDHEIAGTST